MILIVGNCHASSIARCLEVMTDIEIQDFRFKIETLDEIMSQEALEELNTKVEEADKVFVISRFKDLILSMYGHLKEKIEIIPYIRTIAYHPDAVPLYDFERKRIRTLMKSNHSALVVYGYYIGLSVEETLKLFCSGVFDYLGYLDGEKRDERIINFEEKLTGWPLRKFFQDLYSQGCFAYTTNHPYLRVFAELSRQLLKKNKIPIRFSTPELILDDRGSRQAIWPIYSEIAKNLGVNGNYEFKLPEDIRAKTGRTCVSISLREFIEDSFKKYSEIGKENIDFSRFKRAPFSTLIQSKAFELAMGINTSEPNEINEKIKTKENHSNHPYSNLPDYRFWRRSVTNLPMRKIDPVIKSKFKIAKNAKVATAGSCFAQHIARTLKSVNFNYFVTETAPPDFSNEKVKESNYNVYSARYGNIYTTRQLIQLLDRVDGKLLPEDEAWLRKDGQYIDPFRPLIEPDGFNTVEELKLSREIHLNCVKEMFEELDIFLFTMGLTEAWRSKIDGSVFPLAPGVSGGVMDKKMYEFVNFSSKMVIEDLENFSKRMFEINPKAKIILTVSPVPMIATYEDQHIMASSTYSKSVLRVAAEEISRNNPNIAYFPSYEVVTNNFNRGKYYDEDLRTVTKDGVDHVMRLLMEHYLSKTDIDDSDEVFLKQLEDDDIICDEEVLDMSPPS